MSPNIASRRTDSEPVIITLSVLAFLQLLFAGAGLGDIIGEQVVFLGMLVVGAAQGGIQFWLRGQVVAADNVVAYVSPESVVVAGSALLGVSDGEPVHVAVTE
jgi:hypothetical protein